MMSMKDRNESGNGPHVFNFNVPESQLQDTGALRITTQLSNPKKKATGQPGQGSTGGNGNNSDGFTSVKLKQFSFGPQSDNGV